MDPKNSVQKGLIVYESKYGATRQYAEWLTAELKLPLMTTSEITQAQIANTDFLVIGTPVYMGRFRIKKWLKKNVKNIDNKKLFFFIVNATAPDEQVLREQFIRDSMPPEIKGNAAFYFLRGRVIHKKLNLLDRFMVGMAARMVKDPVKRKAMRTDLDAVEKESLTPLIKAVNDYCNKKYAQPSPGTVRANQ